MPHSICLPGGFIAIYEISLVNFHTTGPDGLEMNGDHPCYQVEVLKDGKNSGRFKAFRTKSHQWLRYTVGDASTAIIEQFKAICTD
jgi:hypothetical protein